MNSNNIKENNEKAKRIELLLLDVDGVLTSGMVNIFGDDKEMYVFNVYDGYGIKLWKRTGSKVGFITGRNSDAVAHRAKKLGVDFLFRNAADKIEIAQNIAKEEGIEMSKVAFMGDDLQDLALLKAVGFAGAPSNAREEIKPHVHYCSSLHGGDGAVRDFIEFILKAKGEWDKIISQDKNLS